MNYGSFNPVPMTDITLPNIVYDEDVDATTHRITMEYDLKRHGVAIGIVNLGSKTNSCYWYERRTEGWFPEEYPEQCSPYSMLYYNSSVTSNRDLLFGCTDGYIRRLDNDGTDDDIGVTDQAVDSYVVFGPFKLGREIGGDGTISNLRGILGGGGSDGTHSDSDNVTYYIYIGDSPQEVMEKIDAGSYALTGTVYAPGFRRGKRQRQSVRGKYAAIQLRNNSDGETWEFEEIEFDITPVGSLA